MATDYKEVVAVSLALEKPQRCGVEIDSEVRASSVTSRDQLNVTQLQEGCRAPSLSGL